MIVMVGEESLVFWAGAGVFGASTLMFLVIGGRREVDKFLLGPDVFVSFITTVSYVVMAFAIATVTAANDQPVYWSRWLFYIASCSLLASEVGRIIGKSGEEILEMVILTGLTMFCGFLASYTTAAERWWFFALSSAAFIGLLYEIFRKTGEGGMRGIGLFVLVGWSLFPVVFALAPTGIGTITTYVEAILYALLDVFTKIVFGVWTLRAKKHRP